jgi:CHAD domain-containing protein
MTYRFKLREPIASEAGRIGIEQIDMAVKRLTSRQDPDAGIHDARRCLKRLRALLRIIRPALSDADYRKQSRNLAEIGRRLAPERDRIVMLATLSKIERKFGPLPQGAPERVGAALADQVRPSIRGAKVQKRKELLAGLRQSGEFFKRLKRKRIAPEHLSEGIERSYRRARQAQRHSFRDPSDEAFHSWRKAVQQHWRHMQLMSRAWPEVLGGRASEARELSRLLGEDHDLAVLATFTKKFAAGEVPADGRRKIIACCRAWQAELRDLAKFRGARLFAEPARDLSARIMLYWSAAEEMSKREPPHADKTGPSKAVSPKTRRVTPAPSAFRGKGAPRGSGR